MATLPSSYGMQVWEFEDALLACESQCCTDAKQPHRGLFLIWRLSSLVFGQRGETVWTVKPELDKTGHWKATVKCMPQNTSTMCLPLCVSLSTFTFENLVLIWKQRNWLAVSLTCVPRFPVHLFWTSAPKWHTGTYSVRTDTYNVV